MRRLIPIKNDEVNESLSSRIILRIIPQRSKINDTTILIRLRSVKRFGLSCVYMGYSLNITSFRKKQQCSTRDGNGSDLDRVHVDLDPNLFSRAQSRSAGLVLLDPYWDPWILQIRVQNGSDLFLLFFVFLDRVEIVIKLYSLTNDTNIYNFTIDHPKNIIQLKMIVSVVCEDEWGTGD